MRTIPFVLTLAVAAVVLAGCGPREEPASEETTQTAPVETPPPPPPPATAMAMIQPLGSSQVSGQATFTQAAAGGVDVQITLQNADGERGIHVHEGAECGADGKAAGAHWNPGAQTHGKIPDPPHHAGDLGNISGGTLTMNVPEWTLGDGGPNDIVGHTIVVHAKKDDLKTDPSGNSGDRVACGVVTLGGGTPTETPVGAGTEMTPASTPTSK